LRPKAIHDNEPVDELANDYMYLACVKFINSVCLSLYVSPAVVVLTSIKAWEKVSAGMMEVYAAEVLGKLPVIQHFLFGSILHEGPSASS
ncbi:serine/threonine-protein phosphatase 2A activator-like protein, partial [Pisolithus orientalis]|uniref:serine/threonine-protein phosphatase 2A activator-like protein n=1 Tax=Pisolithus orientalis TaxID=936130 RepID=UPI0022244538